MQPDPFRPADYPSSSATSPVPMPRLPKPPRLRLACDACTAAKVKCGKTRPCERCIDNDQECFYSASRRHGKRSRHGKKESALCSPPSSGTANPAAAAAAATATTASTISNCPELVWGDNESSLRAALALGNSPDNLDGWAPHDMDMAFDLDDAWRLSLTGPWKSFESMMPTPDRLQLSDIMPPSKTMSTERSASIEKTAVTAMMSQSSDSHVSRQAHDCEALALRVLHSLHYNQTVGQTADTCKGPHDAADGSALAKAATQVSSVDTVLFANQTALSNLTPLLKCPCARSTHIALLHITILSKAIFWYRVAVTARHHTEGVGLRPMKIELGMLDLDDDDQATLQRAVLLGELRKAERVIETFDACSAREGEAATWIGLTIRKMRDELKAIVQEIKRGQSEWP